MGILNVTPDSFYDGGRLDTTVALLAKAKQMISEGVDIIDIGGYSTRPGAADVPIEEELKRVVPAIRSILDLFPECIISVDTFRADVAAAAVDSGASMVNDVSGGSLDETMFSTVGKLDVPYCLMHMRGTPRTMAQQNHYDDLIFDIITWFHQTLPRVRQHGVKDIIIDPGFGFAKGPTQNFEVLHGLDKLSVLGEPMLVGLSRKSMIWKTLGTTPDQSLNGTAALNMIALRNGADILRVHDVREAVECIKLNTLTLAQKK